MLKHLKILFVMERSRVLIANPKNAQFHTISSCKEQDMKVSKMTTHLPCCFFLSSSI